MEGHWEVLRQKRLQQDNGFYVCELAIPGVFRFYNSREGESQLPSYDIFFFFFFNLPPKILILFTFLLILPTKGSRTERRETCNFPRVSSLLLQWQDKGRQRKVSLDKSRDFCLHMMMDGFDVSTNMWFFSSCYMSVCMCMFFDKTKIWLQWLNARQNLTSCGLNTKVKVSKHEKKSWKSQTARRADLRIVSWLDTGITWCAICYLVRDPLIINVTRSCPLLWHELEEQVSSISTSNFSEEQCHK